MSPRLPLVSAPMCAPTSTKNSDSNDEGRPQFPITRKPYHARNINPRLGGHISVCSEGEKGGNPSPPRDTNFNTTFPSLSALTTSPKTNHRRCTRRASSEGQCSSRRGVRGERRCNIPFAPILHSHPLLSSTPLRAIYRGGVSSKVRAGIGPRRDASIPLSISHPPLPLDVISSLGCTLTLRSCPSSLHCRCRRCRCYHCHRLSGCPPSPSRTPVPAARSHRPFIPPHPNVTYDG